MDERKSEMIQMMIENYLLFGRIRVDESLPVKVLEEVRRGRQGRPGEGASAPSPNPNA